MVEIEIVNFGLGIKNEDTKKIFEWGVRIHKGSPTFKHVYGIGIGLWEVKHVIEGHGGKIVAQSVHHTKAPVDDQNINQCITVFTVCLPIGTREGRRIGD
jgi:signal transduction histidine kinase